MYVIVRLLFVLFLKQKTAYEIRLSLVGSEMCIFFFKKKTAYECRYGLEGSERCIKDRGYMLGAIC